MTEDVDTNLVDIKAYAKEKQRGKREKTLYIILMIIFSVVLILSLYTISPLSKIQSIAANGNTFLTDQEIIETSGLSIGDSLWTVLFEGKSIENKLVADEPAINSASFQIDNFNDIIIAIDEMPTVAYHVVDGSFHPVLEDGTQLEETVATTYGNEPILTGFDEANLKDFIAQYNELDDTIKGLISEANYSPTESNPDRVIFYMNDGNQIYATINTFAERMSYYSAMKESIGEVKGIFHLEVGAYFTPFEETDESESTENNDEA